MRKGILLFLSLLMSIEIAGCAEQKIASTVSEQNLQPEQSIQNGKEFSESQPSDSDGTGVLSAAETSETTETEEREVKLTIDGQEFPVILYNTPAANALYDLLPLTLVFEDFNSTEKIAYLDDELPTEGEADKFDPDVGDLCWYAPWGNLAIFYKDFRSSNDLISLGRIDADVEAIANMQGDFSAVLSK